MKCVVAALIALSALGRASPSVGTIDIPLVRARALQLDSAARADRRRHYLLRDTSLAKRDGSMGDIAVANALNSFNVQVGVGTPPTYYNLSIDSGSSNTFVGCHKPYVRTSSATKTKYGIYVQYAIGSWQGVEYNDTLTLGNLVIQQQGLGVTTPAKCKDFAGIDGLFGIGPLDLSNSLIGSLATVPTPIDTAFAQGLIPARQLGISFEPGSQNGVMTLGGPNMAQLTSAIAWNQITKIAPSNQYWGVTATKITYGGKSLYATALGGIVDSGTTLILLSDNLFARYMAAIPGATFSSAKATTNIDTTLLKIPVASVASMKPLTFVVGGKSYTLSPSQQLAPQIEIVNADPRYRYGLVQSSGTRAPSGFDFTLGMVFMQRWYTVFDSEGSGRIGFASTRFTTAP